MKRKYVLYIVGAVALILLLVLAAPLLIIDDWSRDLSTNRAATSNDAANPSLRNIDSKLPPEELAEVVRQAVPELNGWKLAGSGQPDVVRFTRTTRLMGFVDDIEVTIQATSDGSTLSAVSQSRTGRGDLGQNPRNLVELTNAVRRALQ